MFLPVREQLKRVRLQACSGIQRIHLDLIQECMEVWKESDLREMVVEMKPYAQLHDTWLYSIRRLWQLTCIEFWFEHRRFMVITSYFFPEIARACRSLERFTITYEKSEIHYRDAEPIHMHKNLKHLHLNAVEIRGNSTLFAQQFRHLKSLHLKVHKFNQKDVNVLEREPH